LSKLEVGDGCNGSSSSFTLVMDKAVAYSRFLVAADQYELIRYIVAIEPVAHSSFILEIGVVDACPRFRFVRSLGW